MLKCCWSHFCSDFDRYLLYIHYNIQLKYITKTHLDVIFLNHILLLFIFLQLLLECSFPVLSALFRLCVFHIKALNLSSIEVYNYMEEGQSYIHAACIQEADAFLLEKS